ncbi:MAG: NTP transferase domain-containing protein [Natronospirillum sp.]|uniref:sugar phosphate nucleotidyltransferase n=1 Tax=Natronospirillum sp. TaxID=2812955 RepID=UPI0025D0E4C7|nr:sugar phosphate nucleotidyltransferase [Natronospirillum sp.]MCH8553210.1 NTP transferase domain-containing protein [Natronospirillum sp.]
MAFVISDLGSRTSNRPGRLSKSENLFVGTEDEQGSDWAIVLAGGSGERMRASISNWMGTYKPKQFCAFVGTRTMLDHTWDRALQLVGSDRIVTVAVTEHRCYFEQMGRRVPGTLIFQPEKIGTAAAVYLALAYILALDHRANIILMPSDHFIYPESRFVELAEQSLATARRYPQQIVLLGAEATWANSDYGWIESHLSITEHSGEDPVSTLMQVDGFIEKPRMSEATRLFCQGALWSTMIVAARAKSLWIQAQVQQPEFFACLLQIRRLLSQARLGKFSMQALDKALKQIFLRMPILDFSRDLLQGCSNQCLVLPMTALAWDDWGRPERILRCIEQYGLDPNSRTISRTTNHCH